MTVRFPSFSWIVTAYVAALGVGVMVAVLTPLESPLWLAAIADVAATLVIFGFSCAFRNSSFYDAYWSVVPPLLLIYWMVAAAALDVRTAVLAALVMAWSVRLTHNWARGWRGLSHEDWRYRNLREQTGAWYPLVDLFGIELLPTVLVFLGSVPLWLAVSAESQPMTWLDPIWMGVGFSALWLEYRADQVLRRHRLDPARAGQVLREDVWAFCRHPNYLGELGFWLALGICGYAVSGSAYAWLGFACMIALFMGVSIPMIERRQLDAKADYKAYTEEVGALLPRFLPR